VSVRSTADCCFSSPLPFVSNCSCSSQFPLRRGGTGFPLRFGLRSANPGLFLANPSHSSHC